MASSRGFLGNVQGFLAFDDFFLVAVFFRADFFTLRFPRLEGVASGGTDSANNGSVFDAVFFAMVSLT